MRKQLIRIGLVLIGLAVALVLGGNAPTAVHLAAAGTTANLVLNPQMTQASSTNPALPANWTQDHWSGTVATFGWQTTGGANASGFLSTTITTKGTGDAKWDPDPMTVPASSSCTYSDSYESSQLNEIDVMDGSGNNTLSTKLNVPAASAWTPVSYTFTSPASGQITIYHLLMTQTVGAFIKISDASLTCQTATPPPAPTVTLTAPADGSTVQAGNVSLTATATNADSVTFKVDAATVGTDTAAPYQATWNAGSAADQSQHTITATATNTTSSATATATVTVSNPPQPPPPTISITKPTGGNNVSGSVEIDADTGTSQGVNSVAFKVDGSTIATDASAPYTTSWDSTTATNATHTLTATVSATGGTVTSSPVTVTVNNQSQGGGNGPSFGPNLYKNPSAETASGSLPANFSKDFYGTNKQTFSWLSGTAHTGSHSVRVSLTSVGSGDAAWDAVSDPANAVPVTPGQTYYFSDWYMSNTDSQLEVAINLSNGSTRYIPVLQPPSSSSWAFASSGPIQMPAGATSAFANQLLQTKTGSLTTDDYYMGTYTPAPYTQGIVTLVFDDGYSSQNTNLLPMLQAHGNMKATFGLITGSVGSGSPYMSVAQAKALQSEGSELTSHTVTHPDLSTLPVGSSCTTTGTVTYELCHSQQVMQSTFSVPSQDFIIPDGAYNTAVENVEKQYYQNARTVNSGYNTADDFDAYQLHSFSIYDNSSGSPGYTPPSQVCSEINYAATHNVWVSFTFHGVAQSGQSPYNTSTTDMNAILDCAASSGAKVETMAQAMADVKSQNSPVYPPNG